MYLSSFTNYNLSILWPVVKIIPLVLEFGGSLVDYRANFLRQDELFLERIGGCKLINGKLFTNDYDLMMNFVTLLDKRLNKVRGLELFILDKTSPLTMQVILLITNQ